MTYKKSLRIKIGDMIVGDENLFSLLQRQE